MKSLIAVVTVVVLSGCASMAPISYQEHCALKGMKLAGVSESNGAATSYGHGSSNYNYGTYGQYNARTDQNVTVNTYEHSENISCAPPQTEKDECQVERFKAAAAPKVEYNESIGMKRLVNSAGYLLFVAPGVISKLIFDDQRNKAEDKSKDIYEHFKGCRSTASK